MTFHPIAVAVAARGDHRSRHVWCGLHGGQRSRAELDGQHPSLADTKRQVAAYVDSVVGSRR